MKNSLVIIGFFVLGTIIGLNDLLPQIFVEIDFSLYALYILMFLVGIGIGADKNA